MKEVNKIWKSTPQVTKDKFNGRAQLEKEKVIGNLVQQYVSEQQYNAIYDGNFSKVNSEVSKLYNECLDIKGWFILNQSQLEKMNYSLTDLETKTFPFIEFSEDKKIVKPLKSKRKSRFLSRREENVRS